MSTTLIEGPVGPIAIHHLAGEGDDTLLVAHATGFLGRVYTAFARELAQQVRVVAIDFRAHGDSGTPTTNEEFSWSGMADDLQAVVDHVDAPTLHGFGHSMGGAALLEVERRNPGTFTSALLFEPIVPPGEFRNFGDTPFSKAALRRRRSFPDRAEALRRYASRPPLGLFRADVLNDYVEHGFADSDDGVTLKCLPESESATFKHAGELNLEMMLEVTLDATIGKSGDGQTHSLLAEVIADALPNGRLQDFPTMTHFGPLQDPVLVAQVMAEVMAGPGD